MLACASTWLTTLSPLEGSPTKSSVSSKLGARQPGTVHLLCFVQIEAPDSCGRFPHDPIRVIAFLESRMIADSIEGIIITLATGAGGKVRSPHHPFNAKRLHCHFEERWDIIEMEVRLQD